MKELSLHILDIAQNSVAAGARSLALTLEEREGLLTVTITDDGKGMPPELLTAATDPFVTTRTTRKVGLGLPLLKLAAEQTGGSLAMESVEGKGTTVKAVFDSGHIDCPPLGDLADSLSALLQGAPGLELHYTHCTPAGAVSFDTREVRAVLGAGISLGEPEISLWLRDYLRELENSLNAPFGGTT